MNESDNDKPVQDLYDDAPLFAGLETFRPTPKEPPPLPPDADKPSTTDTKRKAQGKKAAQNVPVEKPVQTAQAAPRTREPKPLNKESLLLSVTEMCRLLGISRATLIRMDNAGKLPGKIKLGGSIKYHRETIEAWLEEMIEKPTGKSN